MSLATGLIPAITLHGGPPSVRSYPVKISQTIHSGNLAILSTLGSVGEAAAADTSCIGIFAHDITTTATETSTKALVYLADPNTWFEGRTTGSCSERKVGNFADMEITTTNNHRINEDASTTKIFKIMGLDPRDTATGAGRRIYVAITPVYSQIHTLAPD